MTPEQFEADKNYLAAREIAEGFLKKGLLTVWGILPSLLVIFPAASALAAWICTLFQV